MNIAIPILSRFLASQSIFLIAMFLFCFPASATMPELTQRPKQASAAACKAWAAKQDDEAIYMWGFREDGSSSRTLAMQRLMRECMGGPKPEIVGFGSSMGFDEAYCRKHPNTGICRKRHPQ